MAYIMLDLETMSLKNNAAVVAIGAVMMDNAVTKITSEFYMAVDLEDSVRCGLSMDASTVKWWIGQSKEAKDSTFDKPNDLKSALVAFSEWIDQHCIAGSEVGPVKGVFGNGAVSDNVWIDNAFKVTGLFKPWTYREDMCYRTICNIFPRIEIQDELIAHNALCDARYQARYLIALNNRFNIFRRINHGR